MTVKEAEGRVFALVEVRRRGADRLAQVLDDWGTALAATAEADRAWYAYRTGGVDEFRAALAERQDGTGHPG